MLAANGKITMRQLQILIVLGALGTGVIVLPRRVAEFAGQDGWVIVIGLIVLAAAVGWLISAAVTAATQAKPGAGFIAFTGHLLTRPVAYICGLALWVKLVFSAGLELRVFMEITQAVMLPQTPLPAVSIAVLAVCAYAAVKGMETRARVAEILFAVMALPFVFLVGLAFFDTDFSNLQPVLVTPPQELLNGTLRLGFIFTGLECLLLVSPFLRKGKHMGRHVASALAFAGGIILLITVLTIAKFGHGVAAQSWPVLRMMDMLNIPGSFIERQEALMFTFWIITAFAIGNMMLFFGGLLVKDMFKMKTRHLGVLATAVVVFAVSVFPWRDVYGVLDFMYMTAGVFFLVVLPIILLIAAKVRSPRISPVNHDTDGQHETITSTKSQPFYKRVVVGAATYRSQVRTMVILLLLICSLTLTGCWDRVEIENRAFVVAIGIDKEDDNYSVSLSVPLLKKETNEEDECHIKTATGKTITEALKQLDAKTDKTLYYGQAKLLVLGGDLLNDPKMTDRTIQAMKSNREIDLRINVLAAENAKEILEAKPPGETLPGLFVADIYRNKHKLGGASFALDLERLASSYKNGAIIPMIKADDNEGTPLKLNGAVLIHHNHTEEPTIETTGGKLPPLQDKEKPKNKDDNTDSQPKKVKSNEENPILHKLTPEELQGFLWCISHGNKGAIVTVETHDGKVPVKIKKHTVKVCFTQQTENLRATVDIKITAKPEELEHTQITHLLAEKIAQELTTTAKKLQTDHALDGYDWLELLRKKNFTLYNLHHENWHNIFANIEIVPQVTVKTPRQSTPPAGQPTEKQWGVFHSTPST